MPNIGALLKQEIARLSRKEIRTHVEPLKKFATQQRRDLAELKRQVSRLERQIAALERRAPQPAQASAPPSAADGKAPRFVPKGLKSQRERLGLSAADYARLVGVTAQSIYNWERGVAKPRSEQLGILASLRGMGKREARARLEKADGTGAASGAD